MAYDYRRIDVDSHIQEGPDTWTSRMSKARWGDRIPHVAEHEGRDVWIIDGKASDNLSSCPAVAPNRRQRHLWPKRWSDIPVGIYRAKERLQYMDQAGIDCHVMYANTAGPNGEAFLGKDADYEEACVRAYNDLETEEWLAPAPDRFIALAHVPLSTTMDRTVNEIRRCKDNGHRGITLVGTPYTQGMPNYDNAYWDPLWAVCQDLAMPIHMHGSAGTPRTMRIGPATGTDPRRDEAARSGAGFSVQPQFFANFLFSGVLGRYPELVMVSAETGIGWLPWLLESCDHAWDLGRLWDKGMPDKPSDIFRRQCYVDFWYEINSVREYRHIIGVDRIMWETDFPHPTSLWPDTQELLAKSMAGVPEEEQRMILVENPKRVYRL